MFTRGDPAKAIANLKQENRGLFDEIRAFIDKWVSKLKSFYKDQSISMEGEMVAQLERFEELQKLFMEAVQGAGENYRAALQSGEQKSTTQEGDAKYQARATGYDYSLSFAQQIQDYKAGNIPNRDTLVVGRTPDVFQNIGFNPLPMTINKTHVDYALYGTKDADHYLTEPLLLQLPNKIKDPVAIFISQTKGNTSVVALLKFSVNKKQIVAPVVIDGFGVQNSLSIDSNAVTSIYGKNSAINQLYQAAQNEANGLFSLLYVNKKEATTLLQRAGHQLSGSLIPHDGFYHSIREPNSSVKPKFDSVLETQQFKRWFGDWQKHPKNASKIVNSDGTPKVMYHGSPAQFSRFDRKKAKSSGLYGRGFYFTDSDSHAKTYGNTYSVYLNIRNPLQSGGTAVTRQQVRSFLEAVAENEDYSIENYGTYDVDTILNTVMGKSGKADAFKVIQDINATAIGDMVEAAELFNSINGTTFDGIVVPTETVAFYPEQIKSATDNIGTFDGQNDDIYHSLRNTPDDMTIMEREFVRLAVKYEKLDSKAGMDEKKLAQLKADLRAEAGKHKEDSKLWDKEFNRLLKLYEANGRKVTKLEEKLRQQKASSKAALEAMKVRQAKQMEASLREQRAIREELTGQRSNYAIMEREFIRIAKEFEKLESKTGKQGAKDAILSDECIDLPEVISMKEGKRWLLFCAVFGAVFLMLVGWGSRAVTVISQSIPVEREHCIVIDPGHGGVDGGATSCTGKLESAFNLEIGMRLRDLMHFMGYRTRIIRTADISVYTKGDSIAQKKISDLKERVRIVNETPGAILVSIHQNHFSDSRYSGAQVFSPRTQGSKELAENMQRMFSQQNPRNKRQVKKTEGVYLMEHIQVPGVLVECGFLSNPEEEAKLRTPEYQRDICCVIACAISQFLSNT